MVLSPIDNINTINIQGNDNKYYILHIRLLLVIYLINNIIILYI